MQQAKGDRFPTIYEDENYTIWDNKDYGTITIGIVDRRMTIDFTYEEWSDFLEVCSKLPDISRSEQARAEV